MAKTMLWRGMALAALWLASPAGLLAQEAGKQQPQALEKTITKVVKANYLLYLPKDYKKEEGKKWPLLIFLHGSGESGDDLEKVKVHGPPKLIAAGKEFPFIVVSPQAPLVPRRGWDNEVLNTLLDDLIAKYAVDEDRVYLTGLSMGGYGTWAWASSNPERFAALVPICGGGQPRMARRIKDIPIRVYHGAKDEAVPLKESEDMVAALKQAGATDVKLTVYPDAGHDSWTVTYDNPELYTWLREQKRKKPASQ
jgi:predicted peptidase